MLQVEEYTRKPMPVQAVQYDGTLAGAYQLLGWLLSKRGTAGHVRSGQESQGPDQLVVVDEDGRDRVVVQSEWVLYSQDGHVRVLRTEVFQAEYDAAPQAAPSKPPGHWHAGHGPNCRCPGGNARSADPGQPGADVDPVVRGYQHSSSVKGGFGGRPADPAEAIAPPDRTRSAFPVSQREIDDTRLTADGQGRR